MMRFVERLLLRRILLRAVELVEAGWTQDALARDAAGKPCAATSHEAVCFCLIGAVNRAAVELNRPLLAYSARNEVNRHLSYGATVFNDVQGRTQAQVVTTLRDIIAKRLPPRWWLIPVAFG